MALAERADLLARLTLKDELSGPARRASSNFSKSMGKIGQSAKKGVTTAASNIGKVGLVAAAAITGAVKAGVSSLAELEDAVTSVDGAIKQVGKGWTTTGTQIAGIANEIETNVQRAFDDKEITQATTTLIRYGKISEDNLRPAMEVMTDLAAKTGDVESAASLLAKALAAPEKAAGKLARVGIVLTKEQQKQIAAFVKAGKVGKAQKVLLDALAKSTKGAAAASAGPYRDSINILRDVWEDATRALATGFLPVITEVADVLSEELAKKETLARIKAFGDNLAGGVRGLITAVRGIDWNAVGTGMKIAGDGAKAVYDAFVGMPDWVKTAVLTGWGLNKLTGGAVSEILGTGLEVGLKGVFGQFFARGASPANPMWVQSITGGVGGGVAGAAGGAAGLLKFAVGTVASAVVLAAVLKTVQDELITPGLQKQAGQNITSTQSVIASGDPVKTQTALDGVRASVASLSGIQKVLYDLNANGVKTHTEGLERALAEALGTALRNSSGSPDERQDRSDQLLKLSAVRDKVETNRIAVQSGSAAIVAAIRANRPIINVKVSSTRVTTVYRTGTTINSNTAGVRGAELGM